MPVLMAVLGGTIWAAAVLTIGARISVPIALIQPALMGAFLAPGLVMIAMIGRLGVRRFTGGAAMAGGAFPPGTPGAIDQRVLTNTVEQIVLALCIWPLAGFFLGAGTVLALGLNFALARIIFWLGYHISPPLRVLGFGATFYPTIFVALLVLYQLVI